MDIPNNKYPAFWQIIKPDFKAIRYRKNNKKINMINQSLKCPMNELYKFKPDRFRSNETTLPLSQFFVKFEPVDNKKKCRKVEELIEKYSFNLYKYQIDDDTDVEDTLMMSDAFDDLIEDIRKVYISKNYLSLMSFLINRAFMITAQARGNKKVSSSKLDKNKSILIKTLYKVSPDQLLKVFSGNLRPSKEK